MGSYEDSLCSVRYNRVVAGPCYAKNAAANDRVQRTAHGPSYFRSLWHGLPSSPAAYGREWKAQGHDWKGWKNRTRLKREWDGRLTTAVPHVELHPNVSASSFSISGGVSPK